MQRLHIFRFGGGMISDSMSSGRSTKWYEINTLEVKEHETAIDTLSDILDGRDPYSFVVRGEG